MLPVIPRRAITRVDRRYFHGWRVHIKRAREELVAYFKDGDHSSPDRARHAAEQWYLDMLGTLPPPVRTKTKDVRNTTGVIGVAFERQKTKDGHLTENYRAVWPDGHGGYVRRGFSVKKYGKDLAFDFAVSARRDGCAQLQASKRTTIDLEIARRQAGSKQRR